MKTKLISVIILFKIWVLEAQTELDSNFHRPTNNIYLNLLGDASIVSLNYEKLFPIDKGFIIAAKIGLGYNAADPICISFGNPCPPPPKFLTIPIHITTNFGKKRSMFELGLGGTFFNGNRNKNMKIYPTVGYRLQPLKSNKLNFRIFSNFFNPIQLFNYDNILLSPIGLSLGVSF